MRREAGSSVKAIVLSVWRHSGNPSGDKHYRITW